MKITSVNYKKIFPIQQYVNETIGIEIQVDEGDDPDFVMEQARQMVNGWSIQARFPPELLRHEPLEVKPPREFVKMDFTVPTINKQDEKIEIAIDNAKTKEELNKLKPTLPISLTEHFEKRLNELS